MKLCKDCRNYNGGRACRVKYISAETGNEARCFPNDARRSEVYCGAEAKHFKAKTLEQTHPELYADLKYITENCANAVSDGKQNYRHP